MNNNKSKKHIWLIIAEVIGELVLTALFFVTGKFILNITGIDHWFDSVDHEIIALFGIIVFFAVLTAICCIAQWLKTQKKLSFCL